MINRLRLLAGFVLISLIVSLTAAQGVMRGPSEFGQITLVICNGQGTETLTVDANGDPVHSSPDCPDTSVTATSLPPVAVMAATLWSVTRIEPILPASLRQDQRPTWRTSPRAPPFQI